MEVQSNFLLTDNVYTCTCSYFKCSKGFNMVLCMKCGSSTDMTDTFCTIYRCICILYMIDMHSCFDTRRGNVCMFIYMYTCTCVHINIYYAIHMRTCNVHMKETCKCAHPKPHSEKNTEMPRT